LEKISEIQRSEGAYSGAKKAQQLEDAGAKAMAELVDYLLIIRRNFVLDFQSQILSCLDS